MGLAQVLQVSLKYTAFNTTAVLLPNNKQDTKLTHLVKISHGIAELVAEFGTVR